MRTQPKLILIIALAFVLLLVTGCQPDGGPATNDVEEVASPVTISVTMTTSVTSRSAVTETPTAAPTATELPPATLTSQPTSTPEASPTQTATSRPSVTPSPTVNVTATVSALATADPVDRECPDPAPAKPEYRHYYLSGERWPVPDKEPEEHFWLAKPLPGGGRLLYTEWLPYGYDAGGRYLLHNGVDSAEPQGTPILAAADGTVVVAGDDYSRLYGWRCDWYGHLVVIELDRQWRGQEVYVVYGHVLEIKVRPGERVSRGQEVAEVGYGGAAKLPHLHLEVRVGSNEFGATRNPLLWIAPPTTRGIIAGRLVDPDGRPWQGVPVAVVGRSEGAESKNTWTYLGDSMGPVNPDESLAENFVMADLRPGEYEVYVELQGEVYRQLVSVRGGELSLVEIVTEPLKEATSTPSVEATDSP